MRGRLIHLFAAAGLAAALLAAPPARAQFGGGTVTVFDPQMFARQLMQLQQETATVTDLAQQLQYMALNTTQFTGGGWQPNTNLLNNLGNVIATEQGLSYTLANLPAEFSQIFPSYSAPAGTPPATAQQSGQGINNTLATLSGTLLSLQGQAQDFTAENSALAALSAANSGAVGRLQAIQIGNQIALAQVQQAQMLRQTMLTLTNALAVTQANQASQQAQGLAAAQALTAGGGNVPPPQPAPPGTLGIIGAGGAP